MLRGRGGRLGLHNILGQYTKDENPVNVASLFDRATWLCFNFLFSFLDELETTEILKLPDTILGHVVNRFFLTSGLSARLEMQILISYKSRFLASNSFYISRKPFAIHLCPRLLLSSISKMRIYTVPAREFDPQCKTKNRQLGKVKCAMCIGDEINEQAQSN
jgi:hypothetical protein